jgi:NADPH:quinone reductase
MRAAFYERNGPAREVLKLGEVDTPRPGPGEVRVKLATSGVNPSDVKARAGSTRKIAYPRVIPDSDGAGEIDMVGDGVSSARLGERVWVWNAQWMRAYGTCAEYVTLASAQAVRLPAKASFEVGACLGIPAMTAYHAVAVSGAAPGATLLIVGGAGAVGHHAVQFAKAAGATVITTISSPEKADLAHVAGAEHTIDYKRENVGDRMMAITGKKGVDAIIELDIAANAKLIPAALRPRGVVVVYGTGPRNPRCR